MIGNESYTQKFIAADSERYVLACLINWPNSYFEICDTLTPEMFTDWSTVSHQTLFTAIHEINQSGERPDRTKVLQYIVEKGLEGLFQPSAVHHIQMIRKNAAGVTHIKQHAKLITEKWMHRKLQDGCSQIMERSRAGENPHDLAAELEEIVFAAQGVTQADTIKDSTTLVNEATEVLHERVKNKEEGKTPGIPLGISSLDGILKGLKPGRLYFIGGRPGMGKTTMMISAAVHQIKEGKRVGFLSLEMTSTDITFAILSALGLVYRNYFEEGEIGEGKFLTWEKYNDLATRLSALPIFIDDTPGLSVSQIRNKAKMMKIRNGIDVLYLDYIQKCRPNKRTGSSDGDMKEISNAIADLSKTLDIPIVCGSQLSRAVETRSDKRPLLSDMRESGNLEQDAAAIIFPFRPEYYGDKDHKYRNLEDGRSTRGIVLFDVAKHRFGKPGEAEGTFYGEFSRMGGPELTLPRHGQEETPEDDTPF